MYSDVKPKEPEQDSSCENEEENERRIESEILGSQSVVFRSLPGHPYAHMPGRFCAATVCFHLYIFRFHS